MKQTEQISEIVKNLGSRLKGFIRKRVQSSEDAEDILQDVYYQLSQADQLMKPIEQITAWLYTVARNRITDLYRKKKPEYYQEEAISELRELLNQTADSPETQYLQSLVWVELQKALEELPQEQRLVFELNELEGVSFKEIALLTGETENTLLSRKRYAVLYLRKRLQVLYSELITY